MALLPRILVFGISALIGAVIASVVVAAMQDRSPVSSAGAAPEYMLAGADTPSGPGPVVAFDENIAADLVATGGLAPEDLSAAAAALLGDGEQPAAAAPASFVDPTGFPRIRPITQFDGGPFQGANCTLASGSMLARLAFGIVTNGSVLRTLQDDQDGGTGLNDLAQALWRGYGVSAPSGLLRPQQLKDLLASGYGAVVQGVYGEIPAGLRLQPSFTGGHAIYLDGYYPGNAKRGIPEAYYVIDPLGRPGGGYQGDWWPASVVDAFAMAFGGGRIPAMWAFPPGGVAPDVVGPDVLPIPPDAGGASSTPDPDATDAPASLDPGVTPVPVPSGFMPVEPGDLDLVLPLPVEPPVVGPVRTGIDLVPLFDICLINPGLASCPVGLEAVFSAGDQPLLQLPSGPEVNVVFVDSDRANVAIVGFTVDPPATADVKFWVQGESPASVLQASSMSSMNLLGTIVTLARLDVKAATTYAFQAVAGSGLTAGASPVGTFTTGSGVAGFTVALSEVASPVFKLGTSLSPYAHLAEGSFARPMTRLDALGGASCGESAVFGGVDFCLDQVALAPVAGACTSVDVAYDLSGIDAESVAVRAFPASAGLMPGGGLTLDGVLEATGPAGAGSVRVGCLASGMRYQVVLDGIGDDRGVLAVRQVDVP